MLSLAARNKATHKIIRNKVPNHLCGIFQRNKMDRAGMISSIKCCIPPLDGQSHKGQAGRIGVVGGSLEYTGAPYFAGISALKVGADLVHIFCSSQAATVIKSYSPELIVHPLLDRPNAISDITPWFDRLHAIVIGPGLGRDIDTFNIVIKLINIIQDKKIPLVIDADGLFLITEKPEILNDFDSPVILTPNKIEYERLDKKLNSIGGLKKLGHNIIILKKGSSDEVISTNADVQWVYGCGGSGRRCGGQGDLLSGSIATFLHWTVSSNSLINMSMASSLSCYGGSCLVRLCNEKAFKIKGRSMLATDMIEYIHESFEEIFGQ